MFTVPTKPAAKLSKPTINDNSERFAFELATNAKNKFVRRTLMPPIKRALNKESFLIKRPPTKKPKIEPTVPGAFVIFPAPKHELNMIIVLLYVEVMSFVMSKNFYLKCR